LSSNPETLIEVLETDTPSRIPCPKGQKVAKRKSKGKGLAMSSQIVDLTGMEIVIKEKAFANTKITEEKDGENVKVWYKILMKDTSIMSESQLKDHQ